MLQFEDIESHGTKIVIYNLWLNDEEIYELSFDDYAEDIMLRDEAKHASGPKLNKKSCSASVTYFLPHPLFFTGICFTFVS